MNVQDPAVGPPERLHPLFLLTGLGGSLRGMTGGYAFVAYLAVSGRLAYALLSAAALLIMLIVGLFIYWRRFEYRVGLNEIRIDSGLLSRTQRSIPYDRIHDVEISQGPVARMFGLAKVKFETGGSAAAKEDEGALQAIALERAQQIRDLVRAHRSSAHPAADAPGEGDHPPVFVMDLHRVFLAGLFNFSLAVFAGLFGLTQTLGDVVGFDPLNRDFWTDLLSSGDPAADFIMAHRYAAIVAGIILLVLVGVLTGLTRTVLRDYGFRLDRTGTGLRRRRGLLTRSDVTVRAARAQAALVASGPVREHFGWHELKLQSLARDEGGSGDHVLAPLAREEEVDALLEELGWRPLSAGQDWQPVSSAYVWTFALGLSPLLIVAAAQALFNPVTALLFTLALVVVLLVRFVAWRRTRYALDGDRLLIRTGWWRRRLLVLPVRRVQSVDYNQNFIDRWFGVASLTFGVAGGSGFSAHHVPALNVERARDLRAQLLFRIL